MGTAIHKKRTDKDTVHPSDRLGDVPENQHVGKGHMTNTVYSSLVWKTPRCTGRMDSGTPELM